MFPGWCLSPSSELSCLPGSFPHPHGFLLNCVIIFKQINSTAEFSCPNDEFAAQMPLISHSPENQLMNSTRLVFGEALRAALCAPRCSPTCMGPSHHDPTPPRISGSSDKRTPPALPGVECHRKEPASCAGKTITVQILIDFGQRQERSLQSREVVRV